MRRQSSGTKNNPRLPPGIQTLRLAEKTGLIRNRANKAIVKLVGWPVHFSTKVRLYCHSILGSASRKPGENSRVRRYQESASDGNRFIEKSWPISKRAGK